MTTRLKTLSARITILIGEHDVDTNEIFTASGSTMAECREKIERLVKKKYPSAARITLKKV